MVACLRYASDTWMKLIKIILDELSLTFTTNDFHFARDVIHLRVFVLAAFVSGAVSGLAFGSRS